MIWTINANCYTSNVTRLPVSLWFVKYECDPNWTISWLSSRRQTVISTVLDSDCLPTALLSTAGCKSRDTNTGFLLDFILQPDFRSISKLCYYQSEIEWNLNCNIVELILASSSLVWVSSSLVWASSTLVWALSNLVCENKHVRVPK